MRFSMFLLTLLATPAAAHELWLAPLDFTVHADATLMAQIANGENFVGQILPYLPDRIARFDDVVDGAPQQVPGRIGDIPAVQIPGPTEGLHVLTYQAKNAVLTYDDWETFVNFTEHKDLLGILDRHIARGYAAAPFKEVYSRYSKSLVAVEEGQGADARMGLTTEIVALTNPYTEDLTDGMRFQLWYDDAPRSEVQMEVFSRAPDGIVTRSTYRTDSEGVVTVPVLADHSYMADSVVIREPAEALAAETGALWETLWANMTWYVPG